ncbi:MAG: hypothetical protein M3443_03650 [Actinomycetota bacterium]|nr:hypothetical protein [Actinomycetota bacterium]
MTVRMLPVALVLFAVGLLAVVAIFVLSAVGQQASWLWAVSMLLPVGLILGLIGIVRR